MHVFAPRNATARGWPQNARRPPNEATQRHRPGPAARSGGTPTEIRQLGHDLAVCKVASLADADLTGELFLVARTEGELSLVCLTADAPPNTLAREDGWKAFVVQGVLDFSLVGILSRISGALASAGIGIFAVSTYNTDYILVKAENFAPAAQALAAAGYTIV